MKKVDVDFNNMNAYSGFFMTVVTGFTMEVGEVFIAQDAEGRIAEGLVESVMPLAMSLVVFYSII